MLYLSAHEDFNVIEMVEYNPERDDTEARTARVFEKALNILLSPQTISERDMPGTNARRVSL
jgi:hypothetical protein